MSDDYTANRQTTGTVAVGGSVTSEIDYSGDRDWFAVTLEAGNTYRIDLVGSPTDDANALRDPYLRGIYDAGGDLIAGTTNDDGGTGFNSRLEFTAQETATYYVAAGAFGYASTGIGGYTLSVTEIAGADDYEAGTGTLGKVSVGGSATGNIERAGDRDWFEVTLEADRTYRIDLEGLPTAADTLSDPYLRGVYDKDGNLIPGTTNDDGGTGFNSLLSFTAATGGKYYVAAGAHGRRTGTYELSVTDIADEADEVEDDFEAGTETTGAVTVGGSATGTIDYATDRGWFEVTLEAGKTYRIDLEGRSTDDADPLSDPYLRGVYDASGVLISGTTNDNGGDDRNSRLHFTAQETGTYYVAAGAVGSATGTYALSVTEVTDVDDFEAGTGTTGTVTVNGSAGGEIEIAGDRDWFAVTLEADKTYRIDLKGSPTRDGNLSDPYLHGIYDANGNLIAGTTNDDDGTGRNSLLNFTAAADGTYYVAAGADRSRVGDYKLSVTEVPEDFAAGIGTTGAVTVDGSARGEIETAGDHDWFAVTLEADKTYRIDLKGSPTGDGTLRDPYLRGVHDADGNLIPGTTNDDAGSGYNSLVVFTAAADGTYYVAAGAHGSRTGTYRLSVTEIADDFAAGTGTTGTVTVGGSATGEIERTRDRDWFEVTLEADTTYRIDLKGSPTGDGTLRDPYLRGVYDSDGSRLPRTWNDDGGTGENSRLNFTATETGTYYVAAGAFGSVRGTYTLSVEEVM